MFGCTPDESERRCATHHGMPLYPDGYCIEGKRAHLNNPEARLTGDEPQDIWVGWGWNDK